MYYAHISDTIWQLPVQGFLPRSFPPPVFDHLQDKNITSDQKVEWRRPGNEANRCLMWYCRIMYN